MSTRARRARGRPPKTPVSTNRTNFLRKPKAYQNQELNSNVNNVRSASPFTRYRHGRGARGRSSARKSRLFLSQIIAEDDDISSLPEFENDRTSDFTDDIDSHKADGNDSDVVSFDSDDDVLSENESLSTVSSSISKKRLILKRPKTPEIQDDKDIPLLNIPASATDLLLPAEHVLQAIGIYEVLRHFRIILRLSPFTFEDFCAALLSDEQNSLLAELHITLLRVLFREDEGNGTAFGPQDSKDSVNISLFFLDSMTWPEILRAFLDSEKHPEYRRYLSVVESSNYPFVPYEEKMKVLQTLTDLILATTKVREEIINEGNIHYDDHCRACHKLGDLLCCETCSAVYHLTCVEPPMQEVPEDDWLCSVCRAHQVKGVTDCISEAEKSGMLSRQEPIGYDRQARKYWFLCRRIIVEGEKEAWYYSTKYQLEELLECMDPAWEADLIAFLSELKDDILKQMTLTDELTNKVKGNKKSLLDIENAQILKLQTERAEKKVKEEEERKAKEEEERLQKEKEEEERKLKEERQKEKEDMSDKEDMADKEDTADKEDADETGAINTDGDVTEEITETDSEAVLTKENASGEIATEVEETVTTPVTTVTSTTVRTMTTSSESMSDLDDENGGTSDLDGENEPAAKKAKLDDSIVDEAGDKQTKDEDTKGDCCESNSDDKSIEVSTSSALAEAIKSTSEGKTKVISLQSLLPAARQGLLKAVDKNGDDNKSDGQTKTVLLVNRDGDKVTLQVQRQPINKDGDKGNKTTQSLSSSTSVSVSAIEARKMTTRSKTGSLTPKLFTDSVTMTSTSAKVSGKSTDDGVVSENTKTSRSKAALASSFAQQSQYFKLGADGSYKQYQNQYTTNTLALNKHQHNEERDKRRHLSHKFSLTQTFDFKWSGNVLGNKLSILATLRLTITALEGNIQAPYMHSNWPAHKQQWQKAVQMSQTPRDFALALSVLEACVKPCVFNSVWHEAIGHVRLNRITISDREEWKKKEKEQRKRREDEDDVRPVVWIKYTLGLKHQIWKLKGEEYRVTGGNGWRWLSSTWRFKDVPQETVGLRKVAKKLREERIKVVKEARDQVEIKTDDIKEIPENDANVSKETAPADSNDANMSKETAPADSNDANMSKETAPADSNDVEMTDVSNSGECVNSSDIPGDGVACSDNSGNSDKALLDIESSSIKCEKMDVDEVSQEGKSEISPAIDNQDNVKKKSSEQNNETADIKVETIKSDEMKVDTPVKKKKSAKQTRLDGIYHDFISFMKNKYKEEKETVFTLELLKKLPEKSDQDIINVSDAMQKRTYYPNVTKPHSKLDSLLERRIKQDETERKQRLTIETQIALKLKLNQAIETAKKKKEEKERKKLAEQAKLLNGDIGTEKESSSLPVPKVSQPSSALPYSCYSACHRKEHGKSVSCYSPSCIKHHAMKNKKPEDVVNDTLKDRPSNESISRSPIVEKSIKENILEKPPPINVDADKDKITTLTTKSGDVNEKLVLDKKTEKVSSFETPKKSEADNVKNFIGTEKSSQGIGKLDISTEDEEVDIEGVKEGQSSSRLLNSSVDKKSIPKATESPASQKKSESQVTNTEDSETSKSSSVSEIVKNLVIKTMAEKAVETSTRTGVSLTSSQVLSNVVVNTSLEDLRAKLPPKYRTNDIFKLGKLTRIVAKKISRVSKNGRLPMCHRFETASNLKSILVLDRNELRKMARLGSKRESLFFNYNCKMNNVCWPYPCPRPFFKTGWRFRTMTLSSLSAAAIQLRILWPCLRWDDMAAKPPAGGTNTVSTETEITTTELLKRREVGADGLRSEFLVRKIVVPLGVPDKPKEKYTPQRSGLRERKRAEAIRQTEPSVTEVWVPEEVLELWEIKQFGEKLEKQRQALLEKAKETGTSQQSTVASQQTATQIKAQMEQQLKQQRLALAQKRIQENQGIKIATTSSISSLSSSSSPATIIINNASSLGKPGATFKTLTVSSPSSLLSPGIIKTMQPKTVITNAGSLLGTQQLRPGIRVQLQGSSLQFRPQTVTLAPKPGTTVVSTSGVSTITRLISPNPTARVISPATAQTKTQTIQIKPQTAGQPVQNLQLIQQPGGQLQVKGFLPGQIIQRMPDGKLQIISLNTSAAATNTSNSTSTPVSSSSLQSQPRPAINIQPQQTIMVSIPGPTSSSQTVTQNRLVIPAQLASSLALGQNASPSTITIPSSRPVLGGTVVTPSAQKHMIITRPGGQVITAQNIASPTVNSLSSPSGTLNSAVIISAPSGVNANIGSNMATVLVNNSQNPTQLSSLSSPVCASGNQTLISTLRPVVASPSLSTTTTSVTTTLPSASLLSGQVISGTSLLPRPANCTSLLNIAGTSGGSITLPASASPASQIPKLLASPPVGAQIMRPLGSTQAQLVIRPGSTLLTGAGQAKVITAQQIKGLTSTPIQLKPAATSSPIKTMLSPQSSTLILPSTTKTTSAAVRSLASHLTLQTASPQQATLFTTPKQQSISASSAMSLLRQGLTLTTATATTDSNPAATTITSPASVSSPSAGAGVPKYAITPQVVEQVVRQALLQNQAPEIQQKLLAMQRQIQQQRQPTSSIGNVSVSSPAASIQRVAQNTVTLSSRTPSSSSSANELRISKQRGLSTEQKEEQTRHSVCGQVMKNILDRIEREEKQEQRNKKKQESAEEKQKRLTVINQQKYLFKHKEALKKEILRKRTLMENNLQQEIYTEMAEKVKKAKISSSPTKSPHAASTVSPNASVLAISKKSVKLHETAKILPANPDSKGGSRKRKQKIISTGPGIKSLNPRERLYCVCKTPYDDSRFYIGCDLCSNWFHGVCVHISEDQAKFIDSYICEECRKQQENTSEELYCLCRTPYDENQFYIGCDRCQDWFHGYCVGISKNEADSIDVYLCPNCKKDDTADSVAHHPLNPSEYQQLTKLLKDLKVHKMAWPFLNPVDPKDVPDYYNIIMEPMDLTIIEGKLNTRNYDKLNDFVKDITKIFDNCRFYNPVGTPYYQCAEVVETYFAQRIKSLRSSNKL